MIVKINGKELTSEELYNERIKYAKYCLTCSFSAIPFLVATELTNHHLQLFFLAISGSFAIMDFYLISRLLYLMFGKGKD